MRSAGNFTFAAGLALALAAAPAATLAHGGHHGGGHHGGGHHGGGHFGGHHGGGHYGGHHGGGHWGGHHGGGHWGGHHHHHHYDGGWDGDDFLAGAAVGGFIGLGVGAATYDGGYESRSYRCTREEMQWQTVDPADCD